MSLISSIQLANNALRATQIGLQVVGQNIANVNTPGYVREDVILQAAPTQRRGNLLLGLGVEVRGIVQRIDRFVEDRLRGASSDRASAELQEQTYLQLEAVVGELGDTDLSTSLNQFFAAINEVLNQPESIAARNLAVLRGRTLASDINRLSGRVEEVRETRNGEVIQAASDINRLLEEVRRLNVQIATVEGGDISQSDAVGLRDQRSRALADLAEIVDIRVDEQSTGDVNVYVGGEFLVFGGIARSVDLKFTSVRGLALAEVQIVETGSRLQATSGKLAGLYAARDEVLGGFLDRLDQFAGTLAFEFNRLFTSGQGLTGYHEIVSQASVDSTTAPLDAAGLPFVPVNGSLQVLVLDRQTGLARTTDIAVDLNGLDHDTSLADLAAALDAVDGLSASITSTGQLRLVSESPTVEFAFANDTSGILAALGVATFFTGNTAGSLGVHEALVQDPGKFAASAGGIGADTANAVVLAGFLDLPLASADGATFSVLYDRLVGETVEASSATQSVAEGFRVFEQALLGQHLAVTGVNLDEEAVRLLTFQRAYQASAKYIATLDELLELLVNL
jgi:flagellar hook-associated protein 1 FlgK